MTTTTYTPQEQPAMTTTSIPQEQPTTTYTPQEQPIMTTTTSAAPIMKIKTRSKGKKKKQLSTWLIILLSVLLGIVFGGGLIAVWYWKKKKQQNSFKMTTQDIKKFNQLDLYGATDAITSPKIQALLQRSRRLASTKPFKPKTKDNENSWLKDLSKRIKR